MVRVLICGDRNWSDVELIRKYVEAMADTTIIIEGEARGADRIARYAAESRRPPLRVIREPALWGKYGLAAGPIRNQKMIDEHQPDYVVAFHADITKSRGTADMLERARVAGIPCTVITGVDQDEIDWGR